MNKERIPLASTEVEKSFFGAEPEERETPVADDNIVEEKPADEIPKPLTSKAAETDWFVNDDEDKQN